MHPTPLPPSAPRSLRDPAERQRRLALLALPHMAPLVSLVADLRADGRGGVPDFDPLDGGAEARILFLLEKPGPMTDATAMGGRVGSGFISRDNDDPTAEAAFRFQQQAGIERSLTLLWNIIPWWNGTRRITAEERKAGADRLDALIDRLPRLTVVVLVGGPAKKAQPRLIQRGLPVETSAHPSPIVRASRPDLWAAIPGQWAKALRHL